MNTKFYTGLIASLLMVASPLKEATAINGKLRPEDFNKMYHLATKGQIGLLRNAVNRGLNIDSLNPEGDTGLCIAVKRKNYIAYNSFRMSGANPRHPCTYKIHKEYKEFLSSTKTVREEKILGNKESLYYNEQDPNLWHWLLGGAIVGGGVLAMSGGSGGGGGSTPPAEDELITPTVTDSGMIGYIDNYHTLIDTPNNQNILDIIFENDTLKDPADITLLPNAITMYPYLKAFIKVENNGSFDNWGTLELSDGTIGLSAYRDDSIIKNNGNIEIKATNGTLGMAASNGATAINGASDLSTDDNGNINLSFKGSTEGDALIGMYADTNSTITNYGSITSTTQEVDPPKKEEPITPELPTDDLLNNILNENSSTQQEDEATPDNQEEEKEKEEIKTPNAGTLVGMGLFNYYTGTNLSQNTVTANNHGTISLSAGYNTAKEIGVSLVGMASYIDDKFLNKNNNPAYAEKMSLNNDGNISLRYQGQYKLSNTALKLGDGGLIGIRADASTTATNKGEIDINLTSTSLDTNVDVASAMLSVHGAELINGDSNTPYLDITQDPVGKITLTNEATSGGVTYGMLSAKGDGSQTRIHNWKLPKLSNHGLIDMKVSNSYAMASFAGGDIINYGMINLGIENGHSYYTNNIGLYSEGKDITDAANLINKGIINVNSVQSVAMQQMFSGSVDMINDGVIYISQKATDSKAFAGNFSTATNIGTVLYKVDNSEKFTYPAGSTDAHDWNIKNLPIATSISISTDENKTKQDFTNKGTIILGEERSSNYNGTFGTSAIQISGQGSATNDDGIIWLKSADPTYRQLNVGMYLDQNAKRAAFVDNKGQIIVDANHSMGILNASPYSASAFNNGNISVNGQFSYGIAGTTDSYISHGTPTNKDANIYVNGIHSAGIYTKDGEVYNFGNIYLNESGTTAIIAAGPQATISDYGTLYIGENLSDLTFYEATDDANITLSRSGPISINGYTLGKASTQNSGGTINITGDMTANISGQESKLLKIIGKESSGYIKNTDGSPTINVENKATAIEIREKGKGYIQAGTFNVKNANTYGALLDNSTLDIDNANVNINISDNATGISAHTDSTINFNKGTINVENATAVDLNNSTLNVKSTINVKNSTAITGSGTITNDGAINVTSNKLCTGILCGINNYAKGFDTTQGSINNKLNLYGNSVNYATMGAVLNGTRFTNNTATDEETGLPITGTISTFNIGIYNNSGIFENRGNVINNYIGVYNNKGNITGEGNYSGNSYAIYQENGSTKLTGGTVQNNQYGIYAIGGSVETSALISAGINTGIYVKNADVTNKGIIEAGNGIGVRVATGGYFNNEGEINIANGQGIYVEKDGTAINSNIINVKGNGYGAYIASGGSFANTGTIFYDSRTSGECTNFGPTGECKDTYEPEEEEKETTSLAGILLENNTTFINQGIIDTTSEDINFNELSKNNTDIIIAKGGTFKGASFIGDIIASKDIVTEGFKDQYENTQSFEGKNNGINVTSQSYMFDTTTKTNDNSTDIILNRKNFEDIIDDKKLAEFLELNYHQERGANIFNALKQAETHKELNTISKEETGKDFYASLPRENMEVLRKIVDTQKSSLLFDNTAGTKVGAHYHRFGKDHQDNLTGFDTDMYSAYISNITNKNSHLKYGFSLVGAYVDSSYDDANSSKENKILMAFAPLIYKNSNFTYLGLANFGAGYGEFERHTTHNTYTADTLDLYYGLSNSLEYSIDMKVAQLIASAELNLQGISSNSAKEKRGLTLKSNNTHSLESGIGLKLRKRLEFNKNQALTLEFGSKYYHEFLSPYQTLNATLQGSELDINSGHYQETKDRIKTTTSATYTNNNMSISAEVSHNIEEENNLEGNIGIKYNF